MAVGEPTDDENGAAKPRLPFEHVFHHNKYDATKETQYAEMADYDQTISQYYDKRTNGARKETWSQQIEMFLGNKTRLDMLEQLKKSWPYPAITRYKNDPPHKLKMISIACGAGILQ